MSSFARYLSIVGASLVLGLAPGCVSKPTVTVQAANLRGIGTMGVTLEISLLVTNPNSFDVQIRNVRSQVKIADKYWLDPIQFNPNAWLAANKSTVVPVPVVIPWRLVPQLLAESASSNTISYRVTGAADVTAVRALGIEKNDQPVDETGSISRQALLDMAGMGGVFRLA